MNRSWVAHLEYTPKSAENAIARQKKHRIGWENIGGRKTRFVDGHVRREHQGQNSDRQSRRKKTKLEGRR